MDAYVVYSLLVSTVSEHQSSDISSSHPTHPLIYVYKYLPFHSMPMPKQACRSSSAKARECNMLYSHAALAVESPNHMTTCFTAFVRLVSSLPFGLMV